MGDDLCLTRLVKSLATICQAVSLLRNWPGGRLIDKVGSNAKIFLISRLRSSPLQPVPARLRVNLVVVALYGVPAE